MKRIDDPKELQKRARYRRGAEAAARRHIRLHLGWLRGFPFGQAGVEGLGWIATPNLGIEAPRQPLLVTRDLLRQTEYGRNAIKRKFPRALPQVVGDVDAWSARIDQRLDLLKGAVHGAKATPCLAQLLELARFRRPAQRALRLARRFSVLELPIAGLVWVNWEMKRPSPIAFRSWRNTPLPLPRSPCASAFRTWGLWLTVWRSCSGWSICLRMDAARGRWQRCWPTVAAGKFRSGPPHGGPCRLRRPRRRLIPSPCPFPNGRGDAGAGARRSSRLTNNQRDYSQ